MSSTEMLASLPVDTSPQKTMSSSRARMTDEVTRLVAALTLADSNFPNASLLPRIASVPCNNLQHQVLVDYEKLCSILWGATDEIKDRIERDKQKLRFSPPRILLSAVCAVVAALAAPYFLPAVFPFYFPLNMLLAGLVVGLAVLFVIPPNVGRLAAEVRARNLEQLLHGRFPACAAKFEQKTNEKELAVWGDGKITSHASPILAVTNDDEPFPGFGRHQARQIFVCRPKNNDSCPATSLSDLDEAVTSSIAKIGEDSGIADVFCGRAIVIDGRSLRKDSRWLTSGKTICDRRPMLDSGSFDYESVLLFDPDASARVFFCIQVLVPEFMMCTTFFVRPFFAGNSAACEVSVSTLGPPTPDWNYVRERLQLYEQEKDKKDPSAAIAGAKSRNEIFRALLDWIPDAMPVPTAKHKESALGGTLRNIRSNIENRETPFLKTRRPRDIERLDAFGQEELDHEKEEMRRIAEHTEMWPGVFTGMPNWREWNSLTFTADFFGNTEARALVQTLYDRIGRSVLTAIEDLGFETKDYRDDAGRLTINTDKIDQMVVGERVHVRGDSKSLKAPQEEAGASA